MENKCYKCDKRTTLCHATCEDYKDFKARRAKTAEAERRDTFCNAISKESCERSKHIDRHKRKYSGGIRV